jgi:hypothetical protein
VSTFLTINSHFVNSKTTDVKMFIGSGVTLVTIKIAGGDVVCRCAIGTLGTIEGGKIRTEGTGTIATLAVDGGEAILNSTGTITTMTIEGIVDMLKSTGARTIINCKLNPGGTLKHDPGYTDITNWTEADKPIILQASAA